MHSVLGSLKSMLVPIRREAAPFIGVALFAAFFGGWFFAPLFWIGLSLAAFVAYFFRDPPRVTPLDPAIAVSPADGKVAAVALGPAPKALGLGEQRRRRVSVFMSVFDCHVNRAPLAGTVESIVHEPGGFMNAELESASEHNERRSVVLKTGQGKVAVVQIAGLVARRIVGFADEGEVLAAGERFGMIRFGSRVDVYLPARARIIVSEGQTMVAGETVIARFDDDADADRRSRVD